MQNGKEKLKVCQAHSLTNYAIIYNIYIYNTKLVRQHNYVYSPDDESSAGEAGISAGSEGVARHGKICIENT